MRVVLEALQGEFPKHGANVESWARSLAFAVERSGREILEEATNNVARRGMGCTATVATLCGRTLLVAQVGETRGYVLRNRQLVQVTKEHTLLNDFIANGALVGAQEIEGVEHIITRGLGMSADTKADIVRVELQRDDVILLCSDGLWAVVAESKIRQLLLASSEPQVACAALLAAANEAGAPDNIAIVVARFEGRDLPLAGAEPVRVSAVTSPGIAGSVADVAELALRTAPLLIQRAIADTGAHAVLDAAELPDGRMLVALGELGVWLLARDGRVLTRFAEPAHRLVLSDHGDRVILIAFRGEAQRLARLDQLTLRARAWCDARIDCFASDFDGAIWHVARGGTLFAVDVLSEGWEHLWFIEEDEARISSIERDPSAVSVWFERPAGAAGEIWTFEGATHTLRQGRVLPAESPVFQASISARGLFAGWQQGEEEAKPRVFVRNTWQEIPLLASNASQPPRLTEDWLAFPVVLAQGLCVHLFDTRSFQERAQVQLDRAIENDAVPRVGLRFQGERLLIFDDRGRVLVLSLSSGQLLREFRVS